MKDRVPLNPGRVLIDPENGGAPYYATMTRADNPIQEGTPLNKSTLLKDSTAALYDLGEDAVPDDALALAADRIGDVKITSRVNLGDKWALCNGQYVEEPSEAFASLYTAEQTFTSFVKGSSSLRYFIKELNGLFFQVSEDGTNLVVSYATTPDGEYTVLYTWEHSTGVTQKVRIVYGNGLYVVGIHCSIGFYTIVIPESLNPSLVKYKKVYSKGDNVSDYGGAFGMAAGNFVYTWHGNSSTGQVRYSADGVTWTSDTLPHPASGTPVLINEVFAHDKYGVMMIGMFRASSKSGCHGVLLYGDWPNTVARSLAEVDFDTALVTHFEHQGKIYIVGASGIWELDDSDDVPAFNLVLPCDIVGDVSEQDMTSGERAGWVLIERNITSCHVVTAFNRVFLVVQINGAYRAYTVPGVGYYAEVGHKLTCVDITDGVANGRVIASNTDTKDGTNEYKLPLYDSVFVCGNDISVTRYTTVWESRLLPKLPTISHDYAYAYMKVK